MDVEINLKKTYSHNPQGFQKINNYTLNVIEEEDHTPLMRGTSLKTSPKYN